VSSSIIWALAVGPDLLSSFALGGFRKNTVVFFFILGALEVGPDLLSSFALGACLFQILALPAHDFYL
jgi:hypothetical protein